MRSDNSAEDVPQPNCFILQAVHIPPHPYTLLPASIKIDKSAGAVMTTTRHQPRQYRYRYIRCEIAFEVSYALPWWTTSCSRAFAVTR